MINPANVPEYIRKSSWLTRDKFTADDWKLYYEYQRAVKYTDEYEYRQEQEAEARAWGL